jgi:hypothetical protein
MLPLTNVLFRRQAVFDEPQLSTGLEHAAYLLRGTQGFGCAAERPCRHGRIDAPFATRFIELMSAPEIFEERCDPENEHDKGQDPDQCHAAHHPAHAGAFHHIIHRKSPSQASAPARHA